MSFSPFHTRSGVIYSSSLNMPDDTESTGPPSPTPSPPSTALLCTMCPSRQCPCPNGQVTILSTLCSCLFDASVMLSLIHPLTVSNVSLLQGVVCLSALWLRLEWLWNTTFFSSCTEAFCDNLIKELVCSSSDLCLTSLRNFSDLLLTNHGILSPAAGLAGRLRTELDYSLTNSQWMNGDNMSNDNFLNLMSYLVFPIHSLLMHFIFHVTSPSTPLPQFMLLKWGLNPNSHPLILLPFMLMSVRPLTPHPPHAPMEPLPPPLVPVIFLLPAPLLLLPRLLSSVILSLPTIPHLVMHLHVTHQTITFHFLSLSLAKVPQRHRGVIIIKLSCITRRSVDF